MTKLSIAFATAATAFAITTSAYADDTTSRTLVGPPPAAETAKAEENWYGYQTMAADGAAIAFGAVAVATDGDVKHGFATASVLTYVAGPALVHVLHGRPLIGLEDAALRVGAPLVTLLMGSLAGVVFFPQSAKSATVGDGNTNPAVVCGFAGLGVGVAIAMVFDAAVLTRESAPANTKPVASKTKETAITWRPTVGPTKDGVSAGLVGAF